MYHQFITYTLWEIVKWKRNVMIIIIIEREYNSTMLIAFYAIFISNMLTPHFHNYNNNCSHSSKQNSQQQTCPAPSPVSVLCVSYTGLEAIIFSFQYYIWKVLIEALRITESVRSTKSLEFDKRWIPQAEQKKTILQEHLVSPHYCEGLLSFHLSPCCHDQNTPKWDSVLLEVNIISSASGTHLLSNPVHWSEFKTKTKHLSYQGVCKSQLKRKGTLDWSTKQKGYFRLVN